MVLAGSSTIYCGLGCGGILWLLHIQIALRLWLVVLIVLRPGRFVLGVPWLWLVFPCGSLALVNCPNCSTYRRLSCFGPLLSIFSIPRKTTLRPGPYLIHLCIGIHQEFFFQLSKPQKTLRSFILPAGMTIRKIYYFKCRL